MWAFCIFGWRFSVCNVWEIDTQHWLWNRKISDFSKKATLHVIVLGSPMYDQYLVLWLTSHIFITACVDITDTKKNPLHKAAKHLFEFQIVLGNELRSTRLEFLFSSVPFVITSCHCFDRWDVMPHTAAHLCHFEEETAKVKWTFGLQPTLKTGASSRRVINIDEKYTQLRQQDTVSVIFIWSVRMCSKQRNKHLFLFFLPKHYKKTVWFAMKIHEGIIHNANRTCCWS